MKKTFNFIPVFAVLRLSSPNTPQTFFFKGWIFYFSTCRRFLCSIWTWLNKWWFVYCLWLKGFMIFQNQRPAGFLIVEFFIFLIFNMIKMGKSIIFLGAGILLIGIIITYFGDWFRWVGNLPFDIRVERDNFKFYFPIRTIIVLSILLSILVRLFR